MTKITLTHVADLTQPTTAATTINADMDIIQSAMDNTLSRDGTSPNQMETNLDMNDYQILNLPEPATELSPLRLKDLQDFNNTGTISLLPTGGTTGQALKKNSGTDYDVSWQDSGTVSSVALTMPSDFNVSGSPVTTTGTLAVTLANSATGTGGFVRATSPTITTPTISGHPVIEGVTPTGATGTGNLVFGTSPTLTSPALTTPNLGTPVAVTLTNGTGLPVGGIASIATGTMVANATGGSASPTATNVAAFTAKTTPVAADTILISDSAASNVLKSVTYANLISNGTLPTQQTFTSGSGTYTTPAGVKFIVVEMIGGGGGGGGSGTALTNSGAGGNTTFGALTAAGGGATSGATGGAGGTASGSLGLQENFNGANGNGPTTVATAFNGAGGSGGVSFYGGAGAFAAAAAGGSAVTNSGSGGAGGGSNGIASVVPAPGGGAGAYIRTLITNPSATYSYAVGAAGTNGAAGTSGYAGGSGGSGRIRVLEFYAA